MRHLIIFCLFIQSSVSMASSLVQVKAIGVSPKGQFVAFEEFGFTHESKVPYSKIRVMNVWKNEYVLKTIFVSDPSSEMKLEQVRAKAKKLANEQLKQLNIST
jgi:predicted secreted protein